MVKDDLRAEIIEALHPVYTNFNVLDTKTENLHTRRQVVENKDNVNEDRITFLEAELQKLKVSFSACSSRSSGTVISAFMRQHFQNDSFSYIGTRMTGPYDTQNPVDVCLI